MLNFLGIGAQKAGTTWLYRHLANHPKIHFPQGKELHFWDWIQAGRRPEKVSWYIRLFEGNDELIKGEITPDYAVLHEYYIERIHSLNPELRILFILRNPIERAWSAAQMGLTRLLMSREEASDKWFFDVFRSSASLARGDYEATLRRWNRVFPRERFLILYYEDLILNPRNMLKETATHLGVDPAYFDNLPEAELRNRIMPGAGWHFETRSPLTAALFAELHQLYAYKINSLSLYLKKDLSAWLDFPTGKAAG
ncbi:MAG: sulfotransferase family protein [Gammaproteobacteria bacterium]